MENCRYSRSETYTTSVIYTNKKIIYTNKKSYTPTRKSGYFMLQSNTIELCCLMEYKMENRNNNFITICKTLPIKPPVKSSLNLPTEIFPLSQLSGHGLHISGEISHLLLITMVDPCPHFPTNPCKVRIFQNYRKTTNGNEQKRKKLAKRYD